jgi:hypothetical protein
MTPDYPKDLATTQDVLTILRELLSTLREMLARMPIAPSGSSGGTAITVDAQELADLIHASPTSGFAPALKPIVDEWAKRQPASAAPKPNVKQTQQAVSTRQASAQSSAI